MEKNPFNELISIIREEALNAYKSPIMTGIITSTFPNIKIKTNGIELDSDDLEISKDLLDRHNLDVNNKYLDKLIAGDKVVLLRQGDLFLVLNKVVKL